MSTYSEHSVWVSQESRQDLDYSKSPRLHLVKAFRLVKQKRSVLATETRHIEEDVNSVNKVLNSNVDVRAARISRNKQTRGAYFENSVHYFCCMSVITKFPHTTNNLNSQ